MNRRENGLTLTEMLVALAIVVIVGSVAVPVVLSLKDALRGAANTQAIVSTALENARAIAMREGQYAGVRFQRDKDGNQYAVYIVHIPQGAAEADNMTVYYKSVEGRKPIRLPDDMAVADMVVRPNHGFGEEDAKYQEGDWIVSEDLQHEFNITDITSFSVIFDSSGRLVKVKCRMRNRHGKFRPNDGGAGGDSNDKMFNSEANVEAGIAEFIQDDYANLGLGGELSRVHFKIFDAMKYKELGTSQKRFDYLEGLPDLYVNQYTGKLMVSDE